MIDFNKLFSETKNFSIFLVEDYEPLLKDIAYVLESLFKNVMLASNGKEALALYKEFYIAEKRDLDILITDINMPELNGVELCKAIKKLNPNQEIIVLSTSSDKKELFELINMGISNFITKPIDDKEFLEKLYQVSKKLKKVESKLENSTLIKLGKNYVWDKERRILINNSNTVDLTPYELLLLELFTCKSPKICSNEDIIQYLKAHELHISEKNIRNLVYKLRKKLPENILDGIYGQGYKLIPLDK